MAATSPIVTNSAESRRTQTLETLALDAHSPWLQTNHQGAKPGIFNVIAVIDCVIS